MRFYFDRAQTPRTYPNGSRVFRTPGPFSSIARVENVPCADGKRRTFDASGEPDTYFSLPGSVRVNGKHVSGFVSFDSGAIDGRPEGFAFLAYAYGKNGAALGVAKCQHCGERVLRSETGTVQGADGISYCGKAPNSAPSHSLPA